MQLLVSQTRHHAAPAPAAAAAAAARLCGGAQRACGGDEGALGELRPRLREEDVAHLEPGLRVQRLQRHRVLEVAQRLVPAPHHHVHPPLHVPCASQPGLHPCRALVAREGRLGVTSRERLRTRLHPPRCDGAPFGAEVREVGLQQRRVGLPQARRRSAAAAAAAATPTAAAAAAAAATTTFAATAASATCGP